MFAYIFISFVLALIFGYIGSERTCGFILPFVLSIILTPVAGIVVLLTSKSNQTAELERRQLAALKQQSTPAAVQPTVESADSKLQKIADLLERNLITREEYELKRRQIIESL
ncbi:MAG TPA: hypothetical protein PLU07_10980 [Ferruginibacter sp.]|nr:hypothetical protein [Ferruginibacter sp.]HRO18708.1 hypothetical protein [Ferruginibacter sp.]